MQFRRPVILPSGFTLVEVLIALIIATAILAPASLWMTRNRVNQGATERLLALQELELAMNRLMIQNDFPERFPIEKQISPNKNLVITGKLENGEMRLHGRVNDELGNILVELQASRFQSNESSGR